MKLTLILCLAIVASSTLSFTYSNDKLSSEKIVEPLQQKGTYFEKMLLKRALKKAEEDEKLLFLCCSTSWNAPNKKMRKKVFTDEEVGNLLNENFICLDVDVEMDADGPKIMQDYGVKIYPTMIIMDTEGNVLNKIAGYQSKEQLMSFVSSSIE